MMKMQGNTTEIDERNLLRLDALLSHGYGLSPQLVMRSKGLSIEAKALYGYLSSFAGAGDTAFPSTSRILEELDISKNRFYKIRKELVSWGFISIETTATSAGLRTVYTLPQNPIAIKTEIDEIANRRNEIKSSLVANLHNEDMVNNTGLIDLRIWSRHLKTVLMHNIRQMSVVAFSTVHVKYLTTVISTNIK